MKRITALLTVLVVIAALFGGCQQATTLYNTSINGDPRPENYHNNIVPPITNNDWDDFDPYASIPDSIKGSTVRFATWVDHTKDMGAVPLANFYNDTGLNIELVNTPENSYVDSILTARASGNAPDVFVSSDAGFPLTLQFAAPIDVVSNVNLNEPIWHKSMLESATIDGHVYLVNTVGSPWSNANLVYYNRSIFTDNGFTTPEEYYEWGNWTWTTMLKVMKDVKELGSDYCGGYIDPDILGGSAGASFCMYDYKTATFQSGVNKIALLHTYQWYADARDQGLLADDLQAFIDGKCGILLADTNGLKNTGYLKDMNWNDIGFTYLPSLEGGDHGKISSKHIMFGIVDGAPNANAAGYFLRYWLDRQNHDIYDAFISSKAGNFYFALTYSDASDMYFNFDATCFSLLESPKIRSFDQKVKTVRSEVMSTELQAVSGTVDEAVTKANKLIEDLIERNK